MLSDTKIKSLKPTEKMYRVLDAERLYIEIRPSGKKVWRLKYTLNGKEGTISLGEYPTVSLAEARKKKEENKILLKDGINPAHDKKNKKLEKINAAENTFKAIAEEYIVEGMKYKSKDYIEQFKRYMEKDVYKVIGHKPIKEVTSADVLHIMRSSMIRVKKHSHCGTGESVSSLNRRFISLVMCYAIATLRADNDPTYAVRHAIEQPETEHARPLEKEEKIRLRTRIDYYGGTATVRNAVLTLAYTMLRASEVRRMKWEYIDLEEKLISFPKASRKRQQERSNKKNHLHLVPMSDQVYNIIMEQYEINPNQPYVFASPSKDGAMLSRTTLNRALVYVDLSDVTTHDFRATASTLLNEKGYEKDWINKQLAHKDPDKTRATYNHAKWLSSRRKMLQDWADIVDSWGK
ncbi:tyrosine-type recombinase/integrase [Acinetobacter haemolyticus]|uniref:Site-specific recombinase, phage integrase family n=1 Tax=Acinetobacter haemolyticus ATCC 19194 TaxID=707232 RepID=D4XRM8_ACIHA|nr:integrase arm-type DNA-binding domain-containing protein [Acinetobacter haemolyticus]EFF82088.1 site-specific recombinase, phage integrase family [Acinetobacter haemolyticus ATCC 19194]NAS08159.1 tyrosine-type recombinase/integrase [Acinetobacter haemolyticus]